MPIRQTFSSALQPTRDVWQKLPRPRASTCLSCRSEDHRSPVNRGEACPKFAATWSIDGPGAKLFDHHGMTEVGPVSYQCPEKVGTLMVIGSSYLAEIIDPQSGEPVARGELGGTRADDIETRCVTADSLPDW